VNNELADLCLDRPSGALISASATDLSSRKINLVESLADIINGILM